MIYLDYAATTPLRKEVLNEMMPFLTNEYGNPSSQYNLGNTAYDAVQRARQVIAKSINAEPDEIFFTSGGSESDSWAIKGTLFKYSRNIITTPIEHHALLNACDTITGINGGLISFVRIDKYGFIDLDDLNKLTEETPGLVSIMMLNNELGTLEPIKKIGNILKDKDYIFHTDAVQAYGHISIDVKELKVDMLSASSHKIYGPKGVGFLYISKDIQKKIRPLINGGQQERNLRGGTENVAGIVGMAKASQLAHAEMSSVNKKNQDLINSLSKMILYRGGYINSPKNSSPNHINFRFDDIRAELWNEFLNEQGFCISSGSACNSLSGEPSHVLMAIGLSEKEANESIRISLGRETSAEDIKFFEKALDIGLELFRGYSI